MNNILEMRILCNVLLHKINMYNMYNMYNIIISLYFIKKNEFF